MTRRGKDSSDVVRFMALFSDLKSALSDQPDKLRSLENTDKKIIALCTQTELAGEVLRTAERRRRTLYASPVDPNFIAAWRDYEQRYARIVSSVSLWALLGELPLGEAYKELPPLSEQWRDADAYGFVAADRLESVIQFAFDTGTDENFFCEEDIERTREGVEAWDELQGSAEFDLRGVLRRRNLVPFVLVPRHVANRYDTEPVSLLLRNLTEAHEAFVYGAAHAALTLMRAVMEATISELYEGQGDNLESRINSIAHRLPDGVRPQRLHRLRSLANGLLHANPDIKPVRQLQEMDEQRLELEIVSFLISLRALIEGAPNAVIGSQVR